LWTDSKASGLKADALCRPMTSSTCASDLFPDCAQLTTNVKVKVCVIAPEVPVTVTELDPVWASALALKVTFCFLPEPGAMVAVTPFGRADRAKLTVPSKVPKSATAIVALADLPCSTETLLGPERKKPPIPTASSIDLANFAAFPVPSTSCS